MAFWIGNWYWVSFLPEAFPSVTCHPLLTYESLPIPTSFKIFIKLVWILSLYIKRKYIRFYTSKMKKCREIAKSHTHMYIYLHGYYVHIYDCNQIDNHLSFFFYFMKTSFISSLRGNNNTSNNWHLLLWTKCCVKYFLIHSNQ
jgi:hypothetical protein